MDKVKNLVKETLTPPSTPPSTPTPRKNPEVVLDLEYDFSEKLETNSTPTFDSEPPRHRSEQIEEINELIVELNEYKEKIKTEYAKFEEIKDMDDLNERKKMEKKHLTQRINKYVDFLREIKNQLKRIYGVQVEIGLYVKFNKLTEDDLPPSEGGKRSKRKKRTKRSKKTRTKRTKRSKKTRSKRSRVKRSRTKRSRVKRTKRRRNTRRR